MTKDEALALALEALEKWQSARTFHERLLASNNSYAAITAIKQAQQAPDDYEYGFRRGLEASASYREQANAYKEAYLKLCESVASMQVFQPPAPIVIATTKHE